MSPSHTGQAGDSPGQVEDGILVNNGKEREYGNQ